MNEGSLSRVTRVPWNAPITAQAEWATGQDDRPSPPRLKGLACFMSFVLPNAALSCSSLNPGVGGVSAAWRGLDTSNQSRKVP